MNKILITATLAAAILFSCGNRNTEKKPPATITAEEIVPGKPIYLNKVLFLERITDFETNPEEWKYRGDKPAIIDFYADWCGPCKDIAPILEELADEYEGRIYVYKIDIDQETELAEIFGIQSIPSLLFIPLNGYPQMMQGSMTKESFVKAIDTILLN